MRPCAPSAVALAACSLGLACTPDPAPPDRAPAGSPTGSDVTLVCSSSTSGAAGGPSSHYPAGPYGQTVGSVLADECFEGLVDPPSVAFATVDRTTAICFHDFYNPGATDAARPKVLVVMLGALWCGPCQIEAAAARKNHDHWAPLGVQFLASVYQNVNADPPTCTDLEYWTKTYALDYPSVLDPTAKLGKYFTTGAFPDNIVIDTRTMTILYADAGQVDFGPGNTTLATAVGM